MAETQQQQNGGGKPLDNLTYDLVTLIYEKSKGLEAYDKYAQDAQDNQAVSSLLQELREQDTQAVTRLKEELHKTLGNQ